MEKRKADTSRLRNLAEEARVLAMEMTVSEHQEMLTRIADQYDQLAEEAEQRERDH